MDASTEVRRSSHISASQLCHEASQPVAVLAVPSGLVLDANDAFCRLFRVSGVEDWTEPLPACAGRGTAGTLSAILRGWTGLEDRWIPRASFRRVDGGRVQGRTGVLPVPGSRRRIALLHLVRGRRPEDPGLRALIDQRLEQLRSLENLRALGEFSSVMVHEIRTPLTSLRIGLDLLQQDPAFDSRLDRRVGLLVEQVHRIDRFLGQVRDFARPLPLRPESLSTRDAVVRVVRRMEERFPLLHVETVIRTAKVHADPDLFREVLENILLNAAEATEGNGRVRIRVSRVRTGTRISVKDDGPGMSGPEKKRAFLLFHTTKRTGTGLGLPLVRKIIDLHGGRVALKSSPGRGTGVTLEFPPGSGRDPCAS